MSWREDVPLHLQPIVDLVALARAVMFAPVGDNHHNAANCPHCSGPE